MKEAVQDCSSTACGDKIFLWGMTQRIGAQNLIIFLVYIGGRDVNLKVLFFFASSCLVDFLDFK